MMPIEPETLGPDSIIAALAGSVSGLWFMPWETMTWPKRMLTLFVGFTCAIFTSPWLAVKIAGPKPTMETVAMCTYVVGAGAHIILPWIVQMVTRALGSGKP